MSATKTFSRKLSVVLAAAVAALAMAAFAAPASALIGLEKFDVTNLEANGDPATQAASHPDANATEFAVASALGAEPFNFPFPIESLKNSVTELPPGFVGNPQAFPRCSSAQLAQAVDIAHYESCPVDAQVGWVRLDLGDVYGAVDMPWFFPLYNLDAPPDTPALFGFTVLGTPAYLSFKTRTGDDYGLNAINSNTPAVLPIIGVKLVFWGVPSDPAHDVDRGYGEGFTCANPLASSSCTNSTSAPLKPFLSLPTSCTGVGPNNSVETTIHMESWDDLGVAETATSLSHDNEEPPNPIGFTGCNSVSFEPSIEARPTTTVADSASGLDADLHLPVREACDLGPPVSCENSEAHLKDATVTLPEGFVVNPAGANGLDGCSAEEFGYTSTGEDGTVHTTPDPASCPDASKQGTVEVETPLLEEPLKGGVYLADPYDNPFGSLLAVYLAVDDKQTGLVIKLAGEVETDPKTGRITTTFRQNPQLPFEDFKLHFFGGAGGALRTPATCGNYTTTTSMTPWSAPDSGPPDTPTDTWAIQTAPGGGACPTDKSRLPNSPDLDAGSVSPVAATATPTVINLRRADGTQEFSSISLQLPPGLTGKLAGIGQCSDAALASAESKSGKQEKAAPSCPASSRVGTVDAAAGAGPAPYNTQGAAYLTGPYKGAPLGMAIVTPATAGPFDLGTVVVRTALRVDRNTAQITAVSDPIPSILQGIPLDLRSVSVKIDRPDFTRNGTSCDPSSFEGNLVTTLSQTVPLSERFQLGECSGLAFKPKLGIRLFGGTKRGAHPALRATLQIPPGATIASATVALPHSEFLDQSHIGTVCTRVQFAAKACPAGSIYGSVKATSPLVDYTLEGNAYLRSSDNKLPDLVMALHGPPSQPVEVDAVGRIDAIKGGIRTAFEGTPDIPVSALVLNMEGGRKGLLQNSTDICKGKHRASAEFKAHNGKTAELKVLLKSSKCGKAKRKAAKGRGAR
ncbi:MAG TPA: hypothetical protein VN758_03140 [Solirubrobacterales bacterium]|nr:hypothetical protein [Solirubrobacterales bacterium]